MIRAYILYPDGTCHLYTCRVAVLYVAQSLIEASYVVFSFFATDQFDQNFYHGYSNCYAPTNLKLRQPPGIWTFEDWLIQIPSPVPKLHSNALPKCRIWRSNAPPNGCSRLRVNQFCTSIPVITKVYKTQLSNFCKPVINIRIMAPCFLFLFVMLPFCRQQLVNETAGKISDRD